MSVLAHLRGLGSGRYHCAMTEQKNTQRLGAPSANSDRAGVVYGPNQSAMPQLVKIGHTRLQVQDRVKILSRPRGYLLPSNATIAAQVKDPEEA